MVQIRKIFMKEYLIFLCLLLAAGCVDDSLDHLPLFEIEISYRQEPFEFKDQVRIEKGFLYRKLRENGYHDLHGLAKFTFPNLTSEQQFDYELLLLSCTQGLDRLQLFVTVHKKFKSVLNVFALDPGEQQILQIYPNVETMSSLDIDLVAANENSTIAQQVFKLTVDKNGKIEQLQ